MRMVQFFAAIVIVFLTLLSPVSAQVEPKTYDPLGAIPRASDGRIEFEFNGYKFAVDEKEFGHYLYMSFEKDFVPTETEKPFLSLGMSGKIDSAAWDKEMLFSSYVPDNFRKDLGESKKQVFESLLKKAKSIYIDVGWYNKATNKGASVRISVSRESPPYWVSDLSKICSDNLEYVKKNISDPKINKQTVLYLNHESGFDFKYSSEEPRDSCNVLSAEKRSFKAKGDLIIFCRINGGCKSGTYSNDKKMSVMPHYKHIDKNKDRYLMSEYFQLRNEWREQDLLDHQLTLKTILSPLPEGIE